jgi:transcription termination factor Rho
MDDSETPINADASTGAAKRVRKPAAKRGRPRAVEEGEGVPLPLETGEGGAPSDSGATGEGESAPRAKRARTRRARSDDAPEASAGGDAAGPSESSVQGGLFNNRQDDSFEPPASGSGEPFKASFDPNDDAPGEPTASEATTDSRPVFVPGGGSARADGGSSQSGGAQGGGAGGVGGQNGGGAAEQARREERKSWWERKKEKKRQKWMERQQGGGGGGGGGGGHAPERGGPGHGHGNGGNGGGGGGGRERAPAQPPPPALQAPIGGLPDPSRFADGEALDAMALELAKDEAPFDLGAIHAEGAVDLAQRLRSLGEAVPGMPPRRALVESLFAWAEREKRTLRERGILDLTDAGHGFIVHSANSYRLYPESTFVPAALVKRHGLRRGQELDVLAQPPRAGERCPAAVRINTVMGTTPELAREVTAFEELTPYYPTNRILVEAPDIHKDISMRAVDLLTPIGFGQRGLIVAPPRTGKTVLLQNIANSISHNFPDVKLILLLIDERPEEVTDFRRHTKGEVVSSTFDEVPESHVHAAEMVIEKARRLVELGQHVVILLDSITRLARAYNALAGNSGKIMSGGIEANALQRPKRFFGSARNIEGAGSLTILGTALVDTNSRMDEVIFEEFKGTGNMELHLDRGLSDKRIFPAINIDRSGTRKEELIYHPDEMLRVYGLRRAMQGIPPVEAMDMFIQRLKKTRTNTEFLLSLNR